MRAVIQVWRGRSRVRQLSFSWRAPRKSCRTLHTALNARTCFFNRFKPCLSAGRRSQTTNSHSAGTLAYICRVYCRAQIMASL